MALPWAGYQTGQYGGGQADQSNGQLDPAVDYSFDPMNYQSPTSGTKKKLGGNQMAMDLASFAPQAVSGIAGIVDAFVGGKRRKEKYQQFEKKAEEILSRKIEYDIPKESLEMLAATQEGAEKVRALSSEALELSKGRTGEEKVPGYDIIKEDIMAGQAQTAQEAVSQGGIESVGDIANIQTQTNNSLKKLAFENLKYRSQATKDYQQGLAQRAQAERAAVGLETVGLSEMAAQKEQKYQIEVLDPHYNKLQFDISQIGNKMAAMDDSVNWGQALGGLLQVGTSALLMGATGGFSGLAGGATAGAIL